MDKQMHTPGPWQVGYLDTHGQAVVVGEHIEIATCWHHCVRAIEKEMHANARLIAAAPEMYLLIERAGRAITDMFEQLMWGNWQDDHGHAVSMNQQMLALRPVVGEMIELRAAIARAKEQA